MRRGLVRGNRGAGENSQASPGKADGSTSSAKKVPARKSVLHNPPHAALNDLNESRVLPEDLRALVHVASHSLPPGRGFSMWGEEFGVRDSGIGNPAIRLAGAERAQFCDLVRMKSVGGIAGLGSPCASQPGRAQPADSENDRGCVAQALLPVSYAWNASAPDTGRLAQSPHFRLCVLPSA